MPHKKTARGVKNGKKVASAKKTVKNIVEFYYMTGKKVDAKSLSMCITAVPSEQVEVWTELNLMEVVMENDSLIFQDARECFIDPLDLEFIKEHHFETIYQISYDDRDELLVRHVLREILQCNGGMVCADTDDFEPSYTVENIQTLCDYK